MWKDVASCSAFLFIYDSYFFNAGTFPPLGDLLLFVIIYILIYFKIKNVLGIMLAYLLIVEWILGGPLGGFFGAEALKIATYVRMGASLLALGILLLKAVKRRM